MRYLKSRILNKNGKPFRTQSKVGRIIFEGVKNGQIPFESFVLSEGQRLDLVAANFYDDPTMWWVIASASGIGWQCQVPPGTLLKIPTSKSQIEAIVGG